MDRYWYMEGDREIDVEYIVNDCENRFEDERLRSIYRLYSKQYILSNNELIELFNSTQFRQLRLLDLSKQPNLIDEYIKILSKNKYFVRIEEINLLATPITKLSIDYIGNSKFIGTERDYPDICNKYDICGTNIIINTNIKYNQKKLEYFDTRISYNRKNLSRGCEPYEHGIKTIEIIN
jgi:hypothetical protein